MCLAYHHSLLGKPPKDFPTRPSPPLMDMANTRRKVQVFLYINSRQLFFIFYSIFLQGGLRITDKGWKPPRMKTARHRFTASILRARKKRVPSHFYIYIYRFNAGRCIYKKKKINNNNKTLYNDEKR